MFWEEIKNHALDKPTEEVCGILILEDDFQITIKREKNEHPTPDKSFLISPAKFIEYKLNKRVLGIYHSHPATTERPSKSDRALSEEMGIPYLIYSLKTDKFFLYFPESYESPPLLGRPYIKGFHECTCVFKDYFSTNLNINITKWNKNYWLPEDPKKANKLLLNILKNNLIKVDKKKLDTHDVIVFEFSGGKRMHVGIYLGDDMFVHQPTEGLSQRQLLDNRWQKKIKYIYRTGQCV